MLDAMESARTSPPLVSWPEVKENRCQRTLVMAPSKAGQHKETSNMADSLVLTFDKEKDTPGTGKFKESTTDWDSDRMPVGSLYVTKAALAKIGNPSKIRVTIEAG